MNALQIASTVKDELSKSMDSFGYQIIQTLVTDIEPDAKVRDAMNEINAAQRIRYSIPPSEALRAFVFCTQTSLPRNIPGHPATLPFLFLGKLKPFVHAGTLHWRRLRLRRSPWSRRLR